MIFQAGNVHDSTSLFNLKEIDTKSGRILNHELENLVFFHANHLTTADLIDEGEII